MKRTITIMAVMAVAIVSMVALTSSEDIDADTGVTDNSVWYCYGDNPTFIFPEYSEGLDVVWTVTDSNGETVPFDNPNNDDSRIHVNLAGYDGSITVSQTVSAPGADTDSITITVIPLHLPAGTNYPVTFHDGAWSETQYITNTTVIEVGDKHVIEPLMEKDGYEFQGWFDEDGVNKIDLTQPITSETHLYAKWKYTGVSGGTVENVTVGSTNTVSFNTSVGLYCEPDAPGSNSISFTVGVLGGFVLDGSVTVTSTGGHITQLSDGRYLLTGISGNVTVNITGETTPIQEPDDDTTDDNPNDSVDVRNNDYLMYAIILIVIAIICVALAVYIMKTRGSRV